MTGVSSHRPPCSEPSSASPPQPERPLAAATPALTVVIVSGLSGGGKASVLRALEDVGYEAVDNPPLEMLEDMVARDATKRRDPNRGHANGGDANWQDTRRRDAKPGAGHQGDDHQGDAHQGDDHQGDDHWSEGTPGDADRGGAGLAVGIDARTRGFDAASVLQAIGRLRNDPALRVELVYCWADQATLLRRFTETRRRHPLVPQGLVSDGIAAEQVLTARLREHADLVVDTSDLPLAELRQLIEQHFGSAADRDQSRMVVSLVSFAYPRGLPPEADLVFDARFLRNPHYDPILRSRTGLDPAVGAYVETDPDFAKYFNRLAELTELILPRFVREGKKYATITIGCTGGRHRSVHLIEKLAKHLTTRVSMAQGMVDGGKHWRLHVTHRELMREGRQGEGLTARPVAHHAETDLDNITRTLTLGPQEA